MVENKENTRSKRPSTASMQTHHKAQSTMQQQQQHAPTDINNNRKSSNQSSTSRAHNQQRQQSAKGVREYLEEMLLIKNADNQLQSMARQANSSI